MFDCLFSALHVFACLCLTVLGFWLCAFDVNLLFVLLAFAVGMDHVRVHPKFLHSNATSHKWALGGTLSLKLKVEFILIGSLLALLLNE